MPSCLSPLFSRFKAPSPGLTPTSSPRSATSTTPSAPHDEKSGHSHSHFADSCCGQTFTSPPAYAAKSSAPLPLSAAELETLESSIDSLDAELRRLSLSIHSHPEAAWKEYRTHDGWKVTRHAYGLETGWEATFEHGSGGPVIGFNSEMDALPGIAISGVAASLSVASALKEHNIAGKVILLGVPAEEADGGKINMINAGAYKPMDACLMLHPAPYNTVGSSLAIAECIVEYVGHTAHAAAAPWEAINAQDAAVLAYNNISALRQQVHPTHRIHGIIINENWVQNVIPGSSKIVFGVRCPTIAEVAVLKGRVAKCFEAAALATGCTYKADWVMAYADLRQNGALASVYTGYMENRHDAGFPAGGDLGGSTDFGNVSYEVPALHPMFQIPCKVGSGNHTVGFTASAALPESHKLTLEAAKGLSVTAWKFMTDAELAAKTLMFAPHVLSAPPVSLSLLPYGLTYHSLQVQVGEKDQRDLLVGYAAPEDHHFAGAGRGRGFINQTVGRYANRLPTNSKFGDVDLVLPGSDVNASGVCLHGGEKGIDTQEWTLVDRASSTLFPFNDATFPTTTDGSEAIYRLVSEAGADGFPLKLEIEGLTVVEASKVAVVLRARIIDGDAEAAKKGTPVNLTVHWGFNLAEFGKGEREDVLDHKLWIESNRVSQLDSKMLATGQTKSTKEGEPLDALDFTQGTASDPASHRTIGKKFLPSGIDHNIVFNSISDEPKVVLTSPDSKVSLAFRTNQGTVQCYTAGGFDGKHSRKPEHKNGEKGYPQFGAIFLEFHQPLATFLHPELQAIAGTDTILRGGEVYENRVEVDIILRE
ncbi:Xaa-Arg dipeptidase, partial [Phenoliferia sp. Uapishka_3]